MKHVKRILAIRPVREYDIDPDPSYLEQEGFEDRLRQYRDGQFAFIGIRVLADVQVENTIQTLSSGGLWGIEDDSDESYLRDVEREELSDLRDVLYQFGFGKRAITAAIGEARG
jgi:hypothetical protein